MSDLIYCHKLKAMHPKLTFAPFPGELGQQVLAQISQTAWQQWLIQQTKIINEYRLDPMDPKALQLLQEEMLSYLEIQA